MVAATTKKTENTFTVFRRQVIQTGSYEPAEASCSVTVAVDAESTQEQIAEQIAEWGATLEMSNYEALGIGYEITEQGVRRLEKVFPGLLRVLPWRLPRRGLVPEVRLVEPSTRYGET